MKLGKIKTDKEPIFELACSECGQIVEVQYELWEELDRMEVSDHFLCEKCIKTINDYANTK